MPQKDPFQNPKPDSRFYRSVPTARVAELLERLLPEHENELGILAHAAGIPERRLYSILRQQRPNTIFDTVDRILTNLGLTHLWTDEPEDGGFADIYVPDIPPPAVQETPEQVTYIEAQRASLRERKRRRSAALAGAAA